ncbi:MAG TPA: hypothetical protein VE621_14030 [Bryobacteraceae bacterium]|nr:hypothetical protein [Bryobacteraceae bacterium]
MNADIHLLRKLVIIGNNEIGVGGDLIMATMEPTVFRNGRQQKVVVKLAEDPTEPV